MAARYRLIKKYKTKSYETFNDFCFLVRPEKFLRMKKFLSIFVISFAAVSNIRAQCPPIVSRAAWGSRQTGCWALPTQPAPYWVVQQMRDIQDLHMDGNGWGDIG